MRNRWCGVGPLLWLAGVVPLAGEEAAPPVDREFRAVWIATVANIDWPSRPGLPADQQQKELVEILDLCSRLRLNAVVLQVRPAADAFYASSLEPWSAYLTGAMGQPPQPLYDPLAFAVSQAHARGIELHAWFNPFRAFVGKPLEGICETHVWRQHPEWVREYGNYLWLDPGEPQVRQHSLQVILDVVRRYDIDGVHFDDYFYPYPVDQQPFPDDASWAAHGQGADRDAWRRQNVDQFIEQVYRAIKQEKRHVKFGISPFGIWRPGHPEGIQGFDAYRNLYADARKWLQEGWLDYFTPQLYWKIDPPAQSYPALLSWWHEQNTALRHLWPGNFSSQLSPRNAGWPADELLRQIELTRAQEGASGNVHFSMKAFAQDYAGIVDQLAAGPYAQPALVPASRWLADAPPPAPQVRVLPVHDVSQETTSPELQVIVAPGDSEPIWLWVLQTLRDGQWQTSILPGSSPVARISGEGLRVVDLRSVNRAGWESAATRWVPGESP